jgi:DNA-directed RNA polymerase specialized sigma54-like protein
MDIESRINNWREWGRDKPHYQRCKSLEGNYKPPPIWHAPKPKFNIDLKDALTVERCVIRLPHKHKMVIVVNEMYPQYLINEHFARTCTKIGISRKPEVFADYLANAKIILRNLLQRA